jgi:hypothetical protein
MSGAWILQSSGRCSERSSWTILRKILRLSFRYRKRGVAYTRVKGCCRRSRFDSPGGVERMSALWPSPAQLEASMTARNSIEREINIVLGKNWPGVSTAAKSSKQFAWCSGRCSLAQPDRRAQLRRTAQPLLRLAWAYERRPGTDRTRRHANGSGSSSICARRR